MRGILTIRMSAKATEWRACPGCMCYKADRCVRCTHHANINSIESRHVPRVMCLRPLKTEWCLSAGKTRWSAADTPLPVRREREWAHARRELVRALSPTRELVQACLPRPQPNPHQHSVPLSLWSRCHATWREKPCRNSRVAACIPGEMRVCEPRLQHNPTHTHTSTFYLFPFGLVATLPGGRSLAQTLPHWSSGKQWCNGGIPVVTADTSGYSA